jgi:hypothetical protein
LKEIHHINIAPHGIKSNRFFEKKSFAPDSFSCFLAGQYPFRERRMIHTIWSEKKIYVGKAPDGTCKKSRKNTQDSVKGIVFTETSVCARESFFRTLATVCLFQGCEYG